MEAMEAMEAMAGSRTGRPSCTATPTVPGPRSCRGSHAFGSWQGSWRTARRAERGEASSAQARVGCRGGGLQARREARVRWRDGAAARAYIEHGSHARDSRDVPVQGLVEAAGVLPGVERGRREMLRRAWVQRRRLHARREARVRWRDVGQRPGLTLNMYSMFVTRPTSQSRGWLKLEAYCQVRRGGGKECSQACVGCRGGGPQARREVRVRWRDGAAALGVHRT